MTQFIIKRIVKQGTKRVFFYPETKDGKRINRTLFARKYDAENLVKQYTKFIANK